MNITMNSAPQPASGTSAGNGTVKGASAANGLPLDPAQVPVLPGAQAPLDFLHFMQVELPAAPDVLPQPELAAVPDDAAAVAIPALAVQEEQTEATEAGQPQPAAMGMPLTPAMMAMPAGLPAALRLMAGAPERQGRATDAALSSAGSADAGALTPAAAGSAQASAPVLSAQLSDTGAAAYARASAQQAQPTVAPQAAAAAPRDAAAPDTQAATPAPSGAGFGVAAPAAPVLAARDGGTLALSGPPTAWRQSLQEALGERLNLQIGKNAEQAVIRLEPPMLGRVEISIRHAAGSLEVNISATHGEVLRQLNTVSESLRNDLAQRQYLDVSVNVSQAPARAQAAAQAGAGFGADAQGRGREQGQDQDERAPGAALAEANQSTNAFSLGARA